ncbi:cation-translocating P-type ATPase [Streptomyces sp. NBC_00572]|uniref:heavy metal translocating P-type ATPase n=1 Tax=Streptomyces sp. NBC_00572 TaxID=2903664 RepID=UPI002254B312|nr:heavy metal translocating P-type ATPase [Streptomyces sp. NBC_00572]MCX4984987.1 heavy metal translocating P-type ATPase [Streptomyces sp. NBC_00572]
MSTDTAELVATDLAIGGMTCAACVARVEKRLSRIEGVRAGVNFATGRARVLHPPLVEVTELVAAVEKAGYTAEPVGEGTTASQDAEAADDGDRLVRLVIVAALSLPVLVLSMVPSSQFHNWQWVCFLLATAVALWGAESFHRNALRALRHGTATMDTLVSLGIVASYTWSVYALFLGDAGEPGMRMPFSLTADAGDDHIYLEAAVGVPLFVLTGRLLEDRARRWTGSALRALAELAVKDVTVLDEPPSPADGALERERLIPIEQLLPEQRFLVRPGERVATDGVVVRGRAALDLSMLTGESVPVDVGPGDRVMGGTLDIGGSLVVRATAVGADTQLARITSLVADAQAGKARAQRLADRVAGVFVPAVMALAGAVLAFWLGAGATALGAVTTAVAILVVACPCALGLATPMALLAATGRGAQLGVLFKGPEVLERLRQIDTVVMDKTGTLTTGRMRLLSVVTVPGRDEDEVLRSAASVERLSEHPIGRAVTAAALERDDAPLPATSFLATTGTGVEGVVDGRLVRVLRPQAAGDLPAVLRTELDRADSMGRTGVVVEVDGAVAAVLVLGDTVRPGSLRTVRRLRAMGVSTVLLTGDGRGAAYAVAGELGIEEVHFSASPERKAEVVEELRRAGRTAAVVGDGVNDAVALARAELGIALGTGTDTAIGAAGVTLVKDDIEVVVDALHLARRALAVIHSNLTWAFAYNGLLIPVAAVGLLNPMLAALAMSASSLLVVANSLRLRTWRPSAEGRDETGTVPGETVSAVSVAAGTVPSGAVPAGTASPALRPAREGAPPSAR